MLNDKYGLPIFQDKDLINLMYAGDIELIDNLVVENTAEMQSLIEHGYAPVVLANECVQSLSVQEFDAKNQTEWFMPPEYKTFDIEEWVLSRAEDLERAALELVEFKNRNLMDLLRWLKYFVDTCRAHNVIWGVGRGSSVASYVLYLIGVNKINPLKYDLSLSEFFR